MEANVVEHSIEELERQFQSARDRMYAAQKAHHEARIALEEAQVRATGLYEHIVEGPRWEHSTTINRILVKRLAGWKNDVVAGPIIKKDGTPGERSAEVFIATAKDLGPYVASGVTP